MRISYAFLAILLVTSVVLAQEVTPNQKMGDTYFQQAEQYFTMEDYQTAIPLFEKANEYYKKVSNNYYVAFNYRRIGISHYNLRDYQKALEAIMQALGVDENLKNDPDIRQDYFNLGAINQEIKSLDKAKTYFNKAIEIDKKLSSNKNLATDLIKLSEIETDQNNYKQALKYLNDSLEISKILEDYKSYAQVLNQAGVIYFKMADFLKAADYFSKALKINIKQKNPYGISDNLSNSARMHLYLGNFVKALKNANESISAVNNLARKRKYAENLFLIGEIYFRAFDFNSAFDSFKKASDLFKELNLPPQTVISLSNLAITLAEQNKMLAAYETINQARTLTEKLEDKEALATCYNALAHIFLKDKQADEALNFITRAFDLNTSIINRPQVALNLFNMGRIYIAKGNHSKALKSFENAAELAKKIQDKNLELDSHLYSGVCFAKLSDFNKAVISFEAAREIAENQDFNLKREIIYINLGYSYANSNSPKQAVKYYKQAIQYKIYLGFTDGSSQAYFGLAKTYNLLGDEENTLMYMKKAGELFEDEIPSPFSEEKINLEEDPDFVGALIDFFIKQYQATKDLSYLTLAFTHHEKTKLKALTKNIELTKLNINNGVEKPIIEIENKLFEQRISFLEKLAVSTTTTDERKTIQDNLKSNFSERKAFIDTIIQKYPIHTIINYPTPPSLEEIQFTIGGKKLILEFAITKKDVVLFLITSNLFEAVNLGAKENILPSIKTFTSLISKPLPTERIKEFFNLAMDLNKNLLKDVIPGDVETLVIIPDGIINYLPFEALVKTGPIPGSLAGADFLVKSYNVIYSPATTIWYNLKAYKKNSVKSLELLDVGDPNYTKATELEDLNERTKYMAEGFEAIKNDLPNLNFTSSEVKQIASNFTAKNCHVNIRNKATKGTLLKTDLTKYKRIHLALLTLVPDKVSADIEPIIFTSDSELEIGRQSFRASEFFNLTIGAELLFLSQTETGKPQMGDGSGLEYFGLTLLYNNFSSFVLTNWQPFPRTNTIFTKIFYKLLNEGKTPVEALRQVKLEIISSRIEIDATSGFDDSLTEKEILEFGRTKLFMGGAHPYMWAGYRLFGIP